jgi:hypothetical protein
MSSAKNRASLDDLLVQMQIMNRLLAAPLKKTLGQQELIKLLVTTDASAADIANVLDTTTATVATTLQRLRKRGAMKA